MVQYFAEQLTGYLVTSHGWVQSYGTRYVRPPILLGDVSRPQPMTVEWTRYAQSRSDRPVKGMLTGPVTMLAWSFVRESEVTAGGCGGAGPDTVFQVGSVTKAVTGLLLAHLAERSVVHLTDPAARYLPDAVPGGVTLLHLATHTAGLPRLPPGLLRYRLLRPLDPYACYPQRRLLRAAPRLA